MPNKVNPLAKEATAKKGKSNLRVKNQKSYAERDKEIRENFTRQVTPLIVQMEVGKRKNYVSERLNRAGNIDYVVQQKIKTEQPKEDTSIVLTDKKTETSFKYEPDYVASVLLGISIFCLGYAICYELNLRNRYL